MLSYAIRQTQNVGGKINNTQHLKVSFWCFAVVTQCLSPSGAFSQSSGSPSLDNHWKKMNYTLTITLLHFLL